MADDVHGEIIELTAVNPQGDLACDITVATEKAREAARRAPRASAPPGARTAGGVEVRFAPEGWDAVQRYMALEAQCCSFLTLRAEQNPGEIVLSVTGRPEAKLWIDQIFA